MAGNDKMKRNKRKLGLKDMPDAPYNRLLDVLRIQSTSGNMYEMQVHIINELRVMRDVTTWFDDAGNIMAVRGYSEAYPCIVAHMDTVHDIVEKFSIFSYKSKGDKILFAKEGAKGVAAGIGGDDKNGVFAALEMIRRVKDIKVVFFVDEEIGCQGSSNINHDFFKDVGYIMQLDRWGNSDIINNMFDDTTSGIFNATIKPLMTKYGYAFTSGFMTDSLTLHDDDVGVSCINISCGYYEHHTVNEKINVNELWDAVNLTHEMIKALGQNKYASNYVGYSYTGYDYSGFRNAEDYAEHSAGKGIVDGNAKREGTEDSALERYMRNQKRTDLTAADIYQDLYDRLINWKNLTHNEREEVKDDWIFLYGYDITQEEISAYAESGTENYDN